MSIYILSLWCEPQPPIYPGLQSIAFTLKNSYKELGLLVLFISIAGKSFQTFTCDSWAKMTINVVLDNFKDNLGLNLLQFNNQFFLSLLKRRHCEVFFGLLQNTGFLGMIWNRTFCLLRILLGQFHCDCDWSNFQIQIVIGRCCDVLSMFVLSKWQFCNLLGAPDRLTSLGARTFQLIFVLWSKKVR